MATTITNFLIGLGMDDTEFKKGEKNVSSGLDSMRSKALQLGALAGGAFGAKQLTFGFAQAADNIGKFSEVFGVIPDDVRAMGNALEQEGGTLEAFMSQIETIQRMRASTPQQIASLFAEAGIRGVDPSVILSAESATDAYLALADVLAALPEKQRLPVADVFGLDEASIRLLSQGRTAVEELIERQRDIRPLTEEMTEAAKEFNQEWKDIRNNIGAVADDISTGLLPIMSGLFSSGNEFFQLLRENASLIDIIGETNQGGRLTAEAAFGEGAAVLDKPIGEVTGPGGELSATNIIGDNFVTQLLDMTLGDIFGSDGPAPTFDDPQTAEMARGMQDRLNNRVEQQQRPIEVKLILDGQVLDNRIIDVNERQDSQALDDITSSTGG
jgi:hypothetical protein